MSNDRYSAPQILLGTARVNGDPGRLQCGRQAGQGVLRDRGVHQKRLGGVADTGPSGLRVQQDSFSCIEIGGFVNVDMAVADAGFDGRHLRIAHDRVDQAGTATGNHHVDEAAGLDQVGDR